MNLNEYSTQLNIKWRGVSCGDRDIWLTSDFWFSIVETTTFNIALPQCGWTAYDLVALYNMHAREKGKT